MYMLPSLTDKPPSSPVSSIGVLYGSGRPNGDYFAGIATIFVTAYTASTIAFNAAATALICGRILHLGRRARAAHGHADPVYTGAAALVVEGALPFTVFSLAYLVAYALGSDVANAFSFYAMFTVSASCGRVFLFRILARPTVR